MDKHYIQKTPTGHASSDWHKADIKAALEKCGWSLSRLSRKNKLHRQAAAFALRASWPRMERLIAEAIGVKPEEIWPSRYNADGTSKRNPPGKPALARRAIRRAHVSTGALVRHVKTVSDF